MKKTNTNKGLKKLIPAAGMLMLSAAMLGTSTFAWFTMNKEVTLTGMTVKTRVGSNLLIQKDDDLTNTAILGESGFVTDEIQNVAALLEPVSTIDGKIFYYTLDANGSGAKLHAPVGGVATPVDNYKLYDASVAASGTGYGNKFSEDYGVTSAQVAALLSGTDGAVSTTEAVGYVDYVFQLKATNTDGGDQDIKLTDLKLYANGDTTSGTEGDKAFRAAVFVSDGIDEGTAFTKVVSDDTLGTAKIYKPSAATNFGTSGTDLLAVNSTTTRAVVSYQDSEAVLATVPADSVKYYKVVVRLWIEGEDTTCNTSTFRALTNDWELDLKMELGQGTGVDELKIN